MSTPYRDLNTKEASTCPDHEDRSLRGRRYAIPYQTVWVEAAALVNARAPRWRLIEADDQVGRIRVEVTGTLPPFEDVVEIRIRLDSDAQTLVDMSSESRPGRWELGRSARRIRRFLAALDKTLRVRPNTVLPPEDGPERATLPSDGRGSSRDAV